jgi:hypothetical protein
MDRTKASMVFIKRELLLAPKLKVSEQCFYFAGDMFCSNNNSQLPSADAPIIKMILYDWSNEE